MVSDSLEHSHWEVDGPDLQFSSNGPGLRGTYKLPSAACKVGRVHKPNHKLSPLVQTRPSLQESQQGVCQLPVELRHKWQSKDNCFCVAALKAMESD